MSPLIEDSRAFPAAPPPDLDDPRKIISNDWDAFRAVERMTDHWDRPGWPPGHRAYYWMLAFPEEPELIAQARSCQQALADLDMDEVPHDGLHITMNKIGSCADVEPGTVDALAQLAVGTLGGGFEIRAEPMAGSTGRSGSALRPGHRWWSCTPPFTARGNASASQAESRAVASALISGFSTTTGPGPPHR